MIRRLLAALFVALTALVIPLAVSANWLGAIVTETDTYVDAVGPLAQQDDVRSAVADRLARQAERELRVGQRTQALQGAIGASGLSPYIDQDGLDPAAAVRAFVRDAVREAVKTVVDSQQFARIWVEANRTFHTQLDAVLSGDRGDGTVTLDLAPLVDQTLSLVSAQGIEIGADVPTRASFKIQSKDLDQAKTVYQGIDKAGWGVPVLALVLAVLALALATQRRKALAWLAGLSFLALAIEALVLLASDSAVKGAADSRNGKVLISAGWDAVTASLWHLLVGGLIVSALVFLGALAWPKVAGRRSGSSAPTLTPPTAPPAG